MSKTTFEAAEPTCINCNRETDDHCHECETCIDPAEMVQVYGAWVCVPCGKENYCDCVPMDDAPVNSWNCKFHN